MNNKVIKAIAIIQIIGGALGILTSFLLIFIHPLLSIIILFLFLLSLVAGIFLLKDKKSGYLLTYIVQILQVPYVITNTITYSFVSGLQLVFFVNYSSQIFGFNTRFWMGSYANIYLFDSPVSEPFSALGFNVLPIIIVLYLVNYQFKQKAQKGNQDYIADNADNADDHK